MNSLRMRGKRFFWLQIARQPMNQVVPILLCSYVKKIKSDETALETGNDMLYSVDAVTSIIKKSDKTAL